MRLTNLKPVYVFTKQTMDDFERTPFYTFRKEVLANIQMVSSTIDREVYGERTANMFRLIVYGGIHMGERVSFVGENDSNPEYEVVDRLVCRDYLTVLVEKVRR